MIKVSEDFVKSVIGNPEYGYFCFMGGVNSDAKKRILAVKDGFYLFEQHEFDSVEYQVLILEQNQEGKDFYDAHRCV